MTPEKILEIASNPICCPCSPWWLKDEVKVGDVQQAALAFANAIIAQARAELIAELKPVAWISGSDSRFGISRGLAWVQGVDHETLKAGSQLAIIPDTKE